MNNNKNLVFENIYTHEKKEIHSDEWYSVAGKDAIVYRKDAWTMYYFDTSDWLLISIY